MCAGTAYWANIGRVVFGMTETQLPVAEVEEEIMRVQRAFWASRVG
jgi:tRNA(Arg) A34 adenosine deaminase TadA